MINYRSIFLFFLIVGLGYSCKKDKNVLGTNVQPSEDALSTDFKDNFNVVCYTKKYDSIASYNARNKFLGSNDDPYFGNLNVGLYLNANLNAANWNFGANAKIDSSEIILVVDNFDFCGDTAAILNYSIFPLDSALSTSRVYLSNNFKLYNKTAISSSSFKFTRLKSGKPAIRLKVDTNFTSRILKGTSDLVSNETFLAKYPGFYIKTNNSPGSQGIIYKCDLEDDESGLVLYYKVDTNQTFKFDFKGNSSVKFNTTSYVYTNANANLKAQLNGDTSAGVNNLFLKGMGDTKLRLYIPEIKSMADSFNVAVNRAEVSLYVDFDNFSQEVSPSQIPRYKIPTKLALIACDSTGKEIYALDQTNATDASRYDGGYDSDNKRYVFNIARHIQAILTGKKKNYGFYVVVADPNAALTALRDNYIDRVVLAGTSNTKLKPKLSLSYIKFKNP